MLQNPFALDIRALGLLRILIGFVLLLDLSIRFSDFEIFYTDTGAVPLNCLYNHQWNIYFTSIFNMSTFWFVQLLLFILTFIVYFFFFIGFKTRTFTVLSWFLLLSIHTRNPFILQGGDDLLRLILFWVMFLPLGARYSADAVLNRNRKEDQYLPNAFFNTATIGYVFLIISVYVVSGLQKSGIDWCVTGNAIYYALSLDQILQPVGKLIYPYKDFLKFTTFAVLYIELIVPFLLLIPVYTTFFRIVVIVIIVGLHIGISLTLFVGLFFIIGICSMAAFLPSSAMDKFDKATVYLREKLAGLFLDIYQKLFLVKITIQYPSASEKFKMYREIATEIFLSFCLGYCILWNISNTHYAYIIRIPEEIRWFGWSLRLDQNWGMFAPNVFKDDGWYVLEGQTAENNLIDIYNDGKPVNYNKPESVLAGIKNDRWRKYTETMLFVDKSFLRGYFCNYSIRNWNDHHTDSKIKTLKVIYMKEVSMPDYKTLPVTQEVLCECSSL